MKNAALVTILSILTVAFAAFCFAATSTDNQLMDAKGTKVQGYAPNGKKSTALTVNSVTLNQANNVAWSVYTPTACKYRMMSTATKAGLTRTIPVNSSITRYKNPATPFINITGCTSGEYDAQ